MEVKPAYLVMITATANNNKYYRMTPKGDRFLVEFGRIGNTTSQTSSYPISSWNKKYNEKIKKGYVDQTHLIEDIITKETPKDLTYDEILNKNIATIVDRLQSMADRAIRDNYTIGSNQVTQAMIDEAQNSLIRLISSESVEFFNDELLKLFSIIPRKMSNVSSYLASTNSDFGEVIAREQDLLDVMQGQTVKKDPSPKLVSESLSQKGMTILDERGLEFSEATNEDILKIKSLLGSCSDKFKNAWVVKNNKTQEKFDNFVKSEGNIKTKLLWHGSRNENWWSIINSGLVLKPTNAVITGKMFGYGTYFATKARKSLGYTSLSGSYWAGGSSNSAFMSLYDVAYGIPYDAYSFDSQYNQLNYDRLQRIKPGAHCLHAHEGKMLRNDEIIVYKEDQTTIKYLVELKN